MASKLRFKSDTLAEDNKTIPEANFMGLDDTYKHGPPKPDGDPWAILLKPELEADKMRCDGWKEEVQNLLIFAGLFSAVVTAFVIESYKLLQPDPNDAIINLLFQIANNHNTTSSFPSTTYNPSSTAASFVRTSSSVRINVFWFLSLILSLTTVLVGTISLQWLREHQAYPGCSAKDILAILHMRSEAIEAWHLPRIFATLPLLLQAALVLFFAGLIDFSIPLGTLGLTIPVIFAIGLTLLFLAATTILPAFQDIFLLSRFYSRKIVPTPCAYKSPQSHAFRSLSRILLQLLTKYSTVVPEVRHKNSVPTNELHLLRRIYKIWGRKTWPSFDREWLSLRDAWRQGILDHDPDLYIHRRHYEATFPLSDITQCLIERIKEAPSTRHTESFLIATYCCFQEISSSIWNATTLEITSNFPGRPDRHNNYLEQLMQIYPQDCSVSKFLIHGGSYDYARFPNLSYPNAPYSIYLRQHCALFYYDQIYNFVTLLLERHKSPILSRYRLELGSRIIQYLLKNACVPLTAPNTDKPPFLAVLKISYHFDQNELADGSDHAVDFIATIFQTIASSCITQDQLMNSLYTHQQMLKVFDTLASKTIAYSQSVVNDADAPNQKYVQDINNQYRTTFQLIAHHLSMEIDILENSDTPTPSILFYFASIFIHRLLCRPPNQTQRVFPSEINNSFRQGLCILLSALTKYKAWIAYRINEAVETRFRGIEAMHIRQPNSGIRFEQAARFSNHWWNTLFNNADALGLHVNEEEPTTLSSSSSGPPRDSTTSSTPPIPASKEGNYSVSPLRPLPYSSVPRTLYSSIPWESIASISDSSPTLPGSQDQPSLVLPFLALDFSLPVHESSASLPPADEGPPQDQ